MNEKANIAVLGAGSWGTALAAMLVRKGHHVILWGRDSAAVAQMRKTGRNDHYLPGFELPPELQLSDDLQASVAGADLVLIVTPSHAFGEILDRIAPYFPKHAGLFWATKGFDPASGRFLHQLVAERLPDVPAAILTGPSFAKEVAEGLPTAVTVHSADTAFAQRIADLVHTPRFRAYTGTDMIGAELGGAMKNVLAVATGVSDGMQFGLNARAGLITRGLNEMLRLGAKLGARAETLMGLAGLGDLALTCTGDLSRNRRLGIALGRGVPLKQAVADIGQVVESIETADTVMRLADKYHLDLAICSGVQRVLRGEVTPSEAVTELLSREQKPEYPRSFLIG